VKAVRYQILPVNRKNILAKKSYGMKRATDFVHPWIDSGSYSTSETSTAIGINPSFFAVIQQRQ